MESDGSQEAFSDDSSDDAWMATPYLPADWRKQCAVIDVRRQDQARERGENEACEKEAQWVRSLLDFETHIQTDAFDDVFVFWQRCNAVHSFQIVGDEAAKHAWSRFNGTISQAMHRRLFEMCILLLLHSIFSFDQGRCITAASEYDESKISMIEYTRMVNDMLLNGYIDTSHTGLEIEPGRDLLFTVNQRPINNVYTACCVPIDCERLLYHNFCFDRPDQFPGYPTSYYRMVTETMPDGTVRTYEKKVGSVILFDRSILNISGVQTTDDLCYIQTEFAKQARPFLVPHVRMCQPEAMVEMNAASDKVNEIYASSDEDEDDM